MQDAYAPFASEAEQNAIRAEHEYNENLMSEWYSVTMARHERRKKLRRSFWMITALAILAWVSIVGLWARA